MEKSRCIHDRPFHQSHRHELDREKDVRLLAVRGNALGDKLTEITTLDHKVLDNAVELGALVSKAEFSAICLFAGSKSAEVLDSLRDGLCPESISLTS